MIELGIKAVLYTLLRGTTPDILRIRRVSI